jgi:hypothetical protein
MKTNKFYFIGILALILVVLSGCEKLEDTIVGKWDAQMVTANAAKKYYWTLNSDGTGIREYINSDNADTGTDSFTYTIDKKLTKTYLIIEGSGDLPGSSEVNGKWLVNEFNDDILKIRRVDLSTNDEEEQTAGSYLVREFIRIN